MSAVVTDQFRILNANNFVESVTDSTKAYYVFLGLNNPAEVGFARTDTWNSNPPSPVDNLDYLSHYHDTSIFGKRITSSNIRRIVRKIEWTSNTKYEMYRHDYNISNNLSPLTGLSRLYDTNYYVLNSDYRVYICIDNGSSGLNPTISGSLDEPKFTDVEPKPAGESGDGYLWKYLFTISPSDVIKFDSTEYIVVPNDWDKPISNISDAEIVRVKENGDSTVNNNQIKKVYIENGGSGYSTKTCDILGDGTGGKVLIETDETTRIVSTTVVSGGSGYTYGIVDLGSSFAIPAKLIPIIPPSKGHGYDIYKELGTDKVLIYARFDDSTKDFPTDTSFSQIGILKDPTTYGSNEIFEDNQYSSLYSMKLSSGTPTVGQEITQTVSGGTARGYVASYDSETQVLKYYQDRSLFFGSAGNSDQTDYSGLSNDSKVLEFSSSGGSIGPFSGSINTSFGDPTPTNKVTVGNKVIDLGVTFTKGLANPEINKSSGDIIYIDNRPLVSRNSRQKEDIKIILEF
jgi:hypothetical protein